MKENMTRKNISNLKPEENLLLTELKNSIEMIVSVYNRALDFLSLLGYHIL